MKTVATTLLLAALAAPLAAQTEAENRANLAMAISMQGFDCARVEGNTAATDVANVYTVMCKTSSNGDAWYQINIENFEIKPMQPAQ